MGNTAPKDITPSSIRCKPQGFGKALKAHFIARCQKLRLENDTSKPVRADTTPTGLTDRIPLLFTNVVSPSGPKIHLNGTSQARDSVSMGGEEWCGPSALPELWVLGQGTSHTTGRLPSPQQNGLLCRPLCVPGPGLQGSFSQRSKAKAKRQGRSATSEVRRCPPACWQLPSPAAGDTQAANGCQNPACPAQEQPCPRLR